MKCNVGGVDRSVCILSGLVLIDLAITNTVRIWGWIGIASLDTGLFRFFPAYTLSGIHSSGNPN